MRSAVAAFWLVQTERDLFDLSRFLRLLSFLMIIPADFLDLARFSRTLRVTCLPHVSAVCLLRMPRHLTEALRGVSTSGTVSLPHICVSLSLSAFLAQRSHPVQSLGCLAAVAGSEPTVAAGCDGDTDPDGAIPDDVTSRITGLNTSFLHTLCDVTPPAVTCTLLLERGDCHVGVLGINARLSRATKPLLMGLNSQLVLTAFPFITPHPAKGMNRLATGVEVTRAMVTDLMNFYVQSSIRCVTPSNYGDDQYPQSWSQYMVRCVFRVINPILVDWSAQCNPGSWYLYQREISVNKKDILIIIWYDSMKSYATFKFSIILH